MRSLPGILYAVGYSEDYKNFSWPGRTKLLNPHKHIKGKGKGIRGFCGNHSVTTTGPVQAITGSQLQVILHYPMDVIPWYIPGVTRPLVFAYPPILCKCCKGCAISAKHRLEWPQRMSTLAGRDPSETQKLHSTWAKSLQPYLLSLHW